MKLAILCTMINNFGRKGFYNVQEIGLGRALARMGHQVTIYKCLKQTGNLTEEKAEPEKDLLVRYIPIKGLGAHGYLPVSLLDPKIDGLLCFSDNQIFLPHVYRWCVKHGIPFVPLVGTTFSVHTGLHRKIMDTWFAMGTLRIFKKVPIIAKTEKARQELLDLGVRSDIRIAPVGLDTTAFKHDFRECDRKALRAKFGYGDDDILICSIARMEPDKRPVDMIEIFNRIKDRRQFKLLIVGEGYLRDTVDKKILEYGIQDRVRIEKRMPFADIWQIYVMADYFLNLNRDEIFGMAIMEAVYYETPVVAAMAPGPSMTLKGLSAHHLCNSDQEVEERLCAPFPTREQLEESAEKLLRTFSWDHCANAFIDTVLCTKNKSDN